MPPTAGRPLEPDPVNTGGGKWKLTPSESEIVHDHQSIGLHVENMQLGWNGRILVDGLSFEAPQLAWTCLLGESGVGKSTLLRTIADLVPVHPGTIVEGSDGKELRGRIAYMAQQDLLLPWLTATENVALGARLRGKNPDLAKVVELLDRTGIAGRADARANEMSGGERQRVALARTLMEDAP
jgi:putative hydroxymethylpyrimidine transport system ATP-binding protein